MKSKQKINIQSTNILIYLFTIKNDTHEKNPFDKKMTYLLHQIFQDYFR